MMNKVLVFIAVVAVVLFANSAYVVTQTEQALVRQFSETVAVVNGPGKDEPGLKFKIPFIQDVVKLDKRVLELNTEPQEFIEKDSKKVIIDSFAKYKIVDPLKFYQSVGNENGLRRRVNKIIEARLRESVGEVDLPTLLSGKRNEIMNQARLLANENVIAGFGVEIVDLRIMRADLPAENSQFVYREMRTAREREAKEYRAQGAEQAQRITAAAEKERTVLLAEAAKTAQVTRGEGEAEATRITAEAFGQDADFYSFYRSMEAYRNTLKKEDTSMVLSPDSKFLRYFNDASGARK
jgi:membrane protease subunit HflC